MWSQVTSPGELGDGIPITCTVLTMVGTGRLCVIMCMYFVFILSANGLAYNMTNSILYV